MVDGPTDLMSAFETRPTSAERPTCARDGDGLNGTELLDGEVEEFK
jgi:hypothetical protein